MKRREFLKNTTLAVAGATVFPVLAKDEHDLNITSGYCTEEPFSGNPDGWVSNTTTTTTSYPYNVDGHLNDDWVILELTQTT